MMKISKIPLLLLALFMTLCLPTFGFAQCLQAQCQYPAPVVAVQYQPVQAVVQFQQAQYQYAAPAFAIQAQPVVQFQRQRQSIRGSSSAVILQQNAFPVQRQRVQQRSLTITRTNIR
jgi:hypothetical protein